MNSNPRPLLVVAAVLTDAAGRVLIAQRPPGTHLAGGWEFPGGKLELNESPLTGLARELHEELGIVMGPGPHRPLNRVQHVYGDRTISIQVWIVQDYSGSPRGLDGQALRWCSYAELADAELLPADAPIVRLIQLPERLTIKTSVSFEVVEASALRTRSEKLRGLLCVTGEQVLRAERSGADFAVLTVRVEDSELRRICDSTALPVYAISPSLPLAFESGATGVNEI